MNLKIQILLVAILCLCTSATHAQQPPDFDAEKAASIFYYDIEQVIKKLKISTDGMDNKKVTEALMTYNNKTSRKRPNGS